jgi:hypothetical protein
LSAAVVYITVAAIIVILQAAISRATVAGLPYRAGAVETRPMWRVCAASAASSAEGDRARNGRRYDSSARPA